MFNIFFGMNIVLMIVLLFRALSTELNFLTFYIFSLLVKVKFANIINILSNKMIIKEVVNRNLNKKNLLDCIFCSSKIISKSIMAPMVSSLKNKKIEQINIIDKEFQNEKNKLLQLRKYIENNFDYVGKDFSKKVREIYYDKKNKKTIYGTVTNKEKEELAEEGIDLLLNGNDGDTVIFRGAASNKNYKVGFGELISEVLPTK